jgi:hypothetical protein
MRLLAAARWLESLGTTQARPGCSLGTKTPDFEFKVGLWGCLEECKPDPVYDGHLSLVPPRDQPRCWTGVPSTLASASSVGGHA